MVPTLRKLIMKKSLLAATLAAAAMMAVAPANAAFVTLSGSTSHGDILNVNFHVIDSSNLIDQIGGTINVAGIGLLNIGGLLNPTSPLVTPNFSINNLYNQADPSPTGFDWFGVGFSLGSFMANLYDENPVGSGSFIFAVKGTSVSDLYQPGHAVTQFEFTSRNDVPEPATFLLFGAAIVGLIASRRKTAFPSAAA